MDIWEWIYFRIMYSGYNYFKSTICYFNYEVFNNNNNLRALAIIKISPHRFALEMIGYPTGSNII